MAKSCLLDIIHQKHEGHKSKLMYVINNSSKIKFTITYLLGYKYNFEMVYSRVNYTPRHLQKKKLSSKQWNLKGQCVGMEAVQF